MSMGMEDVRFSFFQKSFYENSYPFVTKDGLCSQLARSLQSSITTGRRRKLCEIGNIEVYNPPKKVLRPMVLKKCHVEKKDLINALPDELLIEVFRYISGPADRYACASVCMRWLMLQSHLHMNEIKKDQETKVIGTGDELKRNLEGKRATDVRLALVALGTQARGGLGKLTIKGGPRQNPAKAVSNVGLSAVGTCCENLKILSVWDCPKIDNAGFSWIGKGCPQLKVLNVMNCPGFGDAALQAIAAGCPLISSISLEGCHNIGNQGLKAVASSCTQLSCLSVVGCKNVSDSGIKAVVSSCKLLKALKVEKLGIRDEALVAIGENCTSLQKLKLVHLDEISAEGFSLFGKNSNMRQLKHLQVAGCRGLTDSFLEVIGKISKDLKFLTLANCAQLQEGRLLTFMSDCTSLENLHLEKCSLTPSAPSSNACRSLKVLSIINCTGIGAGCLSSISGASSLKELDLNGFTELSDEVLTFFLSTGGSSLFSLNLSGCVKVTSRAIAAVASFCPTLEVLTLEGCLNVTDQGLHYVAQELQALKELNISKCDVTDNGVLALLGAKGPTLKTLSMSGCVRITDRSLYFIEQACNSLEALNLKDCTGLSRGQLDSLESGMWRCQLCC